MKPSTFMLNSRKMSRVSRIFWNGTLGEVVNDVELYIIDCRSTYRFGQVLAAVSILVLS